MMKADTSVRQRVEGRAIPMVGDDVDTDRIIPARYLREITFETLGQYAFFDERFDGTGKPKPHPMNDPRFKGGSILVVNRNFGCGSSREHAPLCRDLLGQLHGARPSRGARVPRGCDDAPGNGRG